VFPDGYSQDYYANLHNTILVAWHDKIMILPHISPFQKPENIHALISPHNDGRIIANMMRLIGYGIIEGSSNKNPILAVKNIIRALKAGENVVILPDGPRGPRHQAKGNVIEIAKISKATIIPFSSETTRYFKFNSWDRLIFPLPFGRITVHFATPIKCDKYTALTVDELGFQLNKLDS
jgi:lysophospholipid acyltransferase (LPLAT)-like uncharacterized protein